MKSPQELRIEFFKVMFGYIILMVLGGLIAVVAVLHVEEKTSYTLPNLETGLLMLASAWGTHVFGPLSKHRTRRRRRKAVANADADKLP